MRSHTGLLVSILLLTSSLAQAEEAGFYVAAAVGQGEQSIDSGGGIAITVANGPVDMTTGPGFFQIVQPDSREVDSKNVAVNATLGYRVNAYLAGELSYIDLGDAEVIERYSLVLLPGTAPAPFTRRITSKVSGPTVSILGSYPLTETFSISLRAGIFFADQEIKQFAQEQTLGNEVWLAGAGVSYSFTKRWTARLEYQRSDDLDASFAIGETRIEQWLLTALYRL